jgi:hypothetical protein
MEKMTSRLARLEEARTSFLEAINGAPDEALAFLRPGDDYALGGLLVHVNGVLERYGQVLDAIVTDPAGEFDAAAVDRAMIRANARAKEGITAASRNEVMATMASLHEHVAAALTRVAARDGERKTPVRYLGGEPYPTSAADISLWLTDHYLEHVPHVAELLDAWRRGT